MVASKKGRFDPRRDILLVLFGLVAACFCGEGVLRLYFALAPDPPHSRYIRDRATGYRLRPGPFWEDDRDPSDRVNSMGFRDREHPVPKPDGVERIVGIGDSFVLGAVPIEENFLRVAGRELGVDVALMGLGGYGPSEYLGVLRTSGLAVDPSRVVLCFYVGNDITGIPMHGAVRAGEVYFTGSASPRTDLLRRSQLFALIERVFVTRIRVANLKRVAQSAAAPDQPSAYYRMVERNRLPVYARDPSPRMEELWARAEEILEAFDRTCRQAEVPWTLLLIPSELQIDPQVRTGVLEGLHLHPEDYDFEGPQKRLRTFAEARGVDTLDLLGVFRDARRGGEPVYIPNDTHWNAAGNLLAARALVEHIQGLRAAGPAP